MTFPSFYAASAIGAYSIFNQFRRFGAIHSQNNVALSQDDVESFDEKFVIEQLSQHTYARALFERELITDKTFTVGNHSLLRREINFFDRAPNLSTSGTTGQGLTFPASKAFMRLQWDIFNKQYQEMGVSGTWRIQFGGRSLKFFGNSLPVFLDRVGKKVFVSQYAMDDESVKIVCDYLLSKNITWLHGYPSMITEFLKIARRIYPELENLHSLGLKNISTSSENLDLATRNWMAAETNAKIFDLYGQTEGVANFFTCSAGALHVNEGFSYVQFLPQNGYYDIVGTNFWNTPFPFIRYSTGDSIDQYFEGRCSCGRTSRRVEGLKGRSDDYITLKSGRNIGRLDHLTKGEMKLRRSQIVQLCPGGIHVILDCEPRDFSSISDTIRARCDKLFGYDLEVGFRSADHFIFEPNGKLRYVKRLD